MQPEDFEPDLEEDARSLDTMNWRRLLQLDARAVLAIAGSALFLLGLLWALPTWLRGQEQADFAGTAARTVPGTVATVQISPVSQGGGGLFNAVTVDFDGRQIYYALPPESAWNPVRKQKVLVTYRVGRQSGKVQVDRVTPLGGEPLQESPKKAAAPAPP